MLKRKMTLNIASSQRASHLPPLGLEWTLENCCT